MGSEELRGPSDSKEPESVGPLENDRHELFAQEYVIHLCGWKAAQACGSQADNLYVAGSEFLANPKIKARIAELKKERIERIQTSQDAVLTEMLRSAMADMKDFVEVDDSGQVKAIPFSKLPPGASRSIKKIKENRTIRENSDGNSVIVNDTFEFELHSKDKNLEMLANHLGLFNKGQADGGQDVHVHIHQGDA